MNWKNTHIKESQRKTILRMISVGKYLRNCWQRDNTKMWHSLHELLISQELNMSFICVFLCPNVWPVIIILWPLFTRIHDPHCRCLWLIVNIIWLLILYTNNLMSTIIMYHVIYIYQRLQNDLPFPLQY